MRPVLFVTGNVPDYRVEGLRLLHERQGIELVTFGRRQMHGGPASRSRLPFPSRVVAPRELFGVAASGSFRAVVVSTAGRTAPLATWAGARRAEAPLILWASLWAHPRTVPHMLGYPLLRRLYGAADAVVTYGPHVSAYVRARGARNIHVAPQNVDNSFWSAPASADPLPDGWPAKASTRFLFVGRDVPEKGLGVLQEAWRDAAANRPDIALVLAGPLDGGPPGALSLGKLEAGRLRDVYGACEVLVVPSIATRRFREPWGLVVNEAMNQRLAVIASDAVGAAAGGLLEDGVNGLLVREGDAESLAGAIERLAADPQLRARLGVRGAEDVRGYTAEAWADGFSAAFASLGLARDR